MNTFLDAAQQALKDQYQAFAREHVAPVVPQLETRTVNWKELWQKLAQSGFLGLTVPKEYGGQGHAFLAFTLLAEALGEQSPAVAVALAEHASTIEVLKRFGTDSQKSRFLPLLAQGECTGTTAFNETHAGSDFKNVSSTATRDGDQFVLNLHKTVVVNAGIAGLCLASAKDGDNLAVFVVDCSVGSNIKLGAAHQLLGFHGLPVHDVTSENHKVARDALIDSAEGFDEIVLYAADIAKTMIAAASLGISAAVLAGSVAHANKREQFGQKIGQFQAIQWKLADMSVDASASKMLVYRAAWSKDEEPKSFRKDASMAKWYATKTARFHSAEAVQILGVSGLVEDSLTERLFRDAKMTEICEGTSEFQKVLIAQELSI